MRDERTERDGDAVQPGSYLHLRDRLRTLSDLEAARAVLEWDQDTYMPPGGAQARSEHVSTLARLAHELLVAPETGELLSSAAVEVANFGADSLEGALVRVVKGDYDRATRVPAALVAELARHSTLASAAWAEARKNDDYPSFAPYLRKTIDLSREYAGHLGYQDDLYDPLLDRFEPGTVTSQVRTTFAELKGQLVPLVRAIAETSNGVGDSVLRQRFDEREQERFGLSVITRFGYDLRRGRQDRAVHPFQISFSRDDARITTRFDPDYLGDGLFSSLHEAGHALYEQGFAAELERTPLAEGASLGVHESQSRLWENLVGRSRPFWVCFYPELQQTFSDRLAEVSLDSFYRAINAVQPSLIRVDADEVTYNLHIMLRFEMELGLLQGDITVDDAPTVWNEKMEELLGLRPPNDRLGILQDGHWSGGLMGYFPTYSLGNILSAQLFDAAVSAHPEIPDEIRQGRFETLRGWLTQNVYRYGRMLPPAELVRRATGGPVSVEPYMAYLRTKYGELYGLDVLPSPG